MEEYDKSRDLYKYLKTLSYINKCEQLQITNNEEEIFFMSCCNMLKRITLLSGLTALICTLIRLAHDFSLYGFTTSAWPTTSFHHHGIRCPPLLTRTFPHTECQVTGAGLQYKCKRSANWDGISQLIATFCMHCRVSFSGRRGNAFLSPPPSTPPLGTSRRCVPTQKGTVGYEAKHCFLAEFKNAWIYI